MAVSDKTKKAYTDTWTDKGTGNVVNYATEGDKTNAWNNTQYANLQGGAGALSADKAKTDANGNTYYEVVTNKGTKQYAAYDNTGALHVVNAARGVDSLSNVNNYYNNNQGSATYSLNGVDYGVAPKQEEQVQTGMSRNDAYGGYSGLMNSADNRYRSDMRQGTDIAEAQAKRDYDNAANDLYKLYRTQQVKLPETLSARGMTGGSTETANLGLMNTYATNLSRSEQNRLKVNAQLEQDYWNKVANNSMTVADKIADAYLGLAKDQISRDEYVSDRANERAYNASQLADERAYNKSMYDYQTGVELANQKDLMQFENQLASQASTAAQQAYAANKSDAMSRAAKNTKNGKTGYAVFDPVSGAWDYTTSNTYAQTILNNGGYVIKYQNGRQSSDAMYTFDQRMDLASLNGSKGGSGGKSRSSSSKGSGKGSGSGLDVNDLQLTPTDDAGKETKDKGDTEKSRAELERLGRYFATLGSVDTKTAEARKNAALESVGNNNNLTEKEKLWIINQFA